MNFKSSEFQNKNVTCDLTWFNIFMHVVCCILCFQFKWDSSDKIKKENEMNMFEQALHLLWNIW